MEADPNPSCLPPCLLSLDVNLCSPAHHLILSFPFLYFPRVVSATESPEAGDRAQRQEVGSACLLCDSCTRLRYSCFARVYLLRPAAAATVARLPDQKCTNISTPSFLCLTILMSALNLLLDTRLRRQMRPPHFPSIIDEESCVHVPPLVVIFLVASSVAGSSTALASTPQTGKHKFCT